MPSSRPFQRLVCGWGAGRTLGSEHPTSSYKKKGTKIRTYVKFEEAKLQVQYYGIFQLVIFTINLIENIKTNRIYLLLNSYIYLH